MITSKEKSKQLIDRLRLNTLHNVKLSSSDIWGVRDYMSSVSFSRFNIRDVKPSGKFKYNLTSRQVLSEMLDYDEFYLSESLADLDASNLILQGEICIDKSWSAYMELDNTRGLSARVAMSNPAFRITTNLLLEKLPKIEGLATAIEYIVENGLFGSVVEFTLYDKPVGCRGDNIIIWELRDY